MIGLVRNEWKKVFLPVLLTTVLLAIAMSVLSCTIYQNYTLHYDLEAWEVGTELFSLLYPLFVVVPLCWNLYYERKNNFLLYVMPRVKIKKYLTAKWIAYALGTLCIIVIPYILSAVFALYVKPPVVPFVENPFSHIFENAFIKTPLLYAVALSLWRGIVSLFVMTFGFILALYCKNIFVILTGPFMYSILENFVLAILCLESPFVGIWKVACPICRVYTFFHQREVKRRYCIRVAHLVGGIRPLLSDLFCAADCTVKLLFLY